MNCPKCKTEIKKNSLKCPKCGSRIGRICPDCGQYNLITNKTCKKCGKELLKVCPHCKSVNLPNAQNCRKCGNPITVTNKVESKTTPKVEEKIEEVSYNANYYSIANAKTEIINAVLDKNINVVSVNGDNEYAKTFIDNSIRKELSAQKIAFLPGKCTPHTQLTPMGFIQDVLLNIFNITNFCINKPQLKKESVKFFKQDFPELNNNEIYDLINILYPESIGEFEELYANKENTTQIVIKIFTSIINRMNTTLSIGNIEFIDNFSFDILNALLSIEDIKDKLTLIITYTKEQSGINHIFPDSLSEENYKDITIAPFTNEQIEPIFANYKNVNMSADLKAKILHFSRHNMTTAEQLINYVEDCNETNTEIKLSDDLNTIVENRMQILKASNYNAYLVLCALAVYGFKFHPVVLKTIFNLNNETVSTLVEGLLRKNYFVSAGIGFEFITLSIWNAVLTAAQKDKEIFKGVNQALYNILIPTSLSSPFIKNIVAQNLNAKEEQYLQLMNIGQQAAYIGDINLYSLCQTQILSILNDDDTQQINVIKQSIYTQLGKLLCETNPQQAIEYLTKAITITPENEQDENLELLGYLASACIKMKNYNGAIEALNKVLIPMPEESKVEVALVKSRFLKPLEGLNNTGTIINLADNDILPVLENAINGRLPNKYVTQHRLFDTLLKTNLRLIQALATQGNIRVFNVIENTMELCRTNKVATKDLMTELHSLLAFAYTMWGNIKTSEKILNDIMKIDDSIKPTNLSRVNLIRILNKFFAQKTELAYDELYQATTLANNVGDDFVKNILKVILGKLVSERTSAKEAMNIYSEQVEYFANVQDSVGVLLSWYFIGQAKMSISGPDEAINLATRALDIAKMPNISNIYFSILFNKLLGNAYMAKQDFEAAQIYIETALNLATQQGLKYQTASCQILYAKFLQDYALVSEKDKDNCIKYAYQRLDIALGIANELELQSLKNKIDKSRTILDSFCQVNNIETNTEG